MLDPVVLQILSQGEHQQYSCLLRRKIAAADRSQCVVILRTVAIDRAIGSRTADDGDFTFEADIYQCNVPKEVDREANALLAKIGRALIKKIKTDVN